MRTLTRLLTLSVLSAVALTACTEGGNLEGDWVRANHPDAWFVAFSGGNQVTLRNATLDVIVVGSYSWAGPDRVDIRTEAPHPRFPESLTLSVQDQGTDWLTLEDADGESWELVRYGPLPEELLGRWLTLPRDDPRYFIELTEPNDVLWRRRFGMRRSEDRVGRGWMRGDSLYMHIWGAPPMHYLYEINGDTLSFERPGIGPFGRYRRAR